MYLWKWTLIETENKRVESGPLCGWMVIVPSAGSRHAAKRVGKEYDFDPLYPPPGPAPCCPIGPHPWKQALQLLP